MPGQDFQDEIRQRVARRKQHYRELAAAVSKKVAAKGKPQPSMRTPPGAATQNADQGVRPAVPVSDARGSKERVEASPKKR